MLEYWDYKEKGSVSHQPYQANVYSKAFLPWSGPREAWYAPKTWLPCFVLSTIVTGGEDLTLTGDNCKEKAGLWILTIFTNPTLRSLDLKSTFVWVDGGGWLPFVQCLSQHCLGYLSTTPSDRWKIKVPRFQLWFPINLNPVSQALQPLPLTHEPVPPLDYGIPCFPSFLFPNLGDIRMISDYKVTLYGTQP